MNDIRLKSVLLYAPTQRDPPFKNVSVAFLSLTYRVVLNLPLRTIADYLIITLFNLFVDIVQDCGPRLDSGNSANPVLCSERVVVIREHERNPKG